MSFFTGLVMYYLLLWCFIAILLFSWQEMSRSGKAKHPEGKKGWRR
jgi:hypothetical protein